MELIEYYRIFKRWTWLVLIAALIAGGVLYVTTPQPIPVYSAQTTIAIGSFTDSPNPEYNEFFIGRELAQTYIVLAQTYDVLHDAAKMVDESLSGDSLGSMIRASVIEETSLLVISATHTSPVIAANAANAVAEQLIIHSPTHLTSDQQTQVDMANVQMDRLNAQLEDLQLALNDLNNRIATETDPDNSLRLGDQRNTLINQINYAANTIAIYSSNVLDLQRRTNSLEILETARVPAWSTTTSNRTQTALLASITGAALAMGFILLIEYLNDSIRTPVDIAEILDLPVLGTIEKFKQSRYEKQTNGLVTKSSPGNLTQEAYHSLRTNLMLRAGGKSKTYLITSPHAKEGKSSTTANLAIALAESGMRVLLIDADMRHPTVHNFFGLENNGGLADFLTTTWENGTLPALENSDFTANLAGILQDTTVPNLGIITAGRWETKNPGVLLGSDAMRHLVKIFQDSSSIDIVLLDSPPCLMLSDTYALAATTDAEVILVLESGKTHRGAALKAKEQLELNNISVQGVVLNKVKPSEMGSYHYYSPYYPRS